VKAGLLLQATLTTASRSWEFDLHIIDDGRAPAQLPSGSIPHSKKEIPPFRVALHAAELWRHHHSPRQL